MEKPPIRDAQGSPIRETNFEAYPVSSEYEALPRSVRVSHAVPVPKETKKERPFPILFVIIGAALGLCILAAFIGNAAIGGRAKTQPTGFRMSRLDKRGVVMQAVRDQNGDIYRLMIYAPDPEEFEMLVDYPHLEELEIVDAHFEGFHWLGACPNLTSLNMINCTVANELPQPQPNRIESIRLGGNFIDPVEHLSQFGSLRMLSVEAVEHPHVNGGDLANSQRLVELRLVGVQLNSEDELGNLKELQRLELKAIQEPIDLEFVKSLPNLRMLNLLSSDFDSLKPLYDCDHDFALHVSAYVLSPDQEARLKKEMPTCTIE